MVSLERSRELRAYIAFAVLGIVLVSYSVRALHLQERWAAIEN